MKVNMGAMDRKVRLGIGAVAVIAGIALLVGGSTVLGIVALVVAAVMVATSRAGYCPLYAPIGFSTVDKE